jgi:beta-mannosidase
MKGELELSGLWELKPVGHFDGSYQSGHWFRQELPGHWQELAELRNYSGRMLYRKNFHFSPEKNRRYWLKLNGVFYWTAAYLNGARLGASQGYFVPALFEITENLAGENELLLEVLCEYEQDKIHKQQILGVFHHWDCLYRDFCPGGIWQPVEILSTGPAAIMESCFRTIYLTPEYARLEGSVLLDSHERDDLELKVSLLPENHSGPAAEKSVAIFKPGGVKSYQQLLDLREYKLWSTWDAGEPNLYRLRLELKRRGNGELSDVFETLFGVRTLALRDYLLQLNGQRLWLRGSNYAPGDYQIGSMTKERYEKDLELARKANLNILRVHAHIEKPEFYEAADRAGMLLWQDFPLQWNYDRSILPEALFQLEKMITRLGHHPSIAIWCMHNEPLKMYDTRKKPSVFDWIRFANSIFFYSWNREVMDKQLLKKARFLDPARPALHCSGEKGLFARDPGDAHLYFGWYFGPLHFFSWFARRRKKHCRMVTEFGAQSFPNYESAIKFMNPELDKLDWQELEKKYLAQKFFLNLFVPLKKFQDLKTYIQATQDYQAAVNRYYIDRLRWLKYRPAGGAISFDFNDCNPAITWSLIDYWRVPKSSYFELAKAFSPVYAFALIDRLRYKLNHRLTIPIFAVNDLREAIAARLDARLLSPISEELYSQTFEFKLEPDCLAQALAKPAVSLRWPGQYSLELRLALKDRELVNKYSFRVSD